MAIPVTIGEHDFASTKEASELITVPKKEWAPQNALDPVALLSAPWPLPGSVRTWRVITRLVALRRDMTGRGDLLQLVNSPID